MSSYGFDNRHDDDDGSSSIDEDESDDSSDDDDSDSSVNDDGHDDEEEEHHPTHAQHKENGNSSYKEKDYRAAIAHYTLAIEVARMELDDLERKLAEAKGKDGGSENGGDNDQAAERDELRRLLASYHGNRAAAFTMLLRYADAIDDCDRAVDLDRTFVKAHFRKAKALTSLGRLDDALRAYSMGLVHDPNHSAALKEVEEVQMIKRRYEDAKSTLAAIDSAEQPKMTSAKARKQARAAMAQIEVVLGLCPSWNDATLVKIDALCRLNRADEAYALTTKLMRLGMGTNNELLYLRARCLFHKGCMDDAMKHLRQILAGDPDNKRAFALVKLIRALGRKKEEADAAYKSRNFDDAVTLYGEAIDLCPVDNATYRAKLFFNRALANSNLRNHESTVDDCTRAIALDDGYTKAYMKRAASYLLLGGERECRRAIQDYERADDLVQTDEEHRDISKKIRAARIQLKRAGQKDCYKILGVSRDATEAEIRKAYRKLALKCHPDRLPSNMGEKEREEAESKFRDINLCHEILTDLEKKRRYDDGVDAQDVDNPDASPRGSGGMGGGMGGMDADILFQMFMQQQQQQRGGRAHGGGVPFGF